MKRLVFFLVFTTIAFTSFSQKIRFTDTSNVWRVNYSYWCGVFYATTPSFFGDTVLNGITYYKLSSNPVVELTYLVREDTLAGKVYYRHYTKYSQPVTDTNEYLGYDYNLNVGDTLVRRGPQGPTTLIVTSLDSVLINNVYHKVWTYWAAGGYKYRVTPATIEGIGDLYGPSYAFYNEAFMGNQFMYCFRTSGSNPALSKAVHQFDNVGGCILGIDEEQREDKVVFPNPVRSFSTLDLKSVIKGNLVIWNQSGQKVYSQELNTISSIPIGRVIQLPGIYFYSIMDYSTNPGRQLRGSFIRE